MACLHLLKDQLDCAIYVDTGFSYPETRELLNYAAGLVPMHVVQSDRAGQNARQGLPADILPVDWTVTGQAITTPKPVTLQHYIGCCLQNIALPLWEKAKALGVTHLVTGQRDQEAYRAPVRDGAVFEGIIRLHPIEVWTTEEVLTFLHTKMTVPAHYAFKAQTSLDCYDCTGFVRESHERVTWMQTRHPALYDAYASRRDLLRMALREAVGDEEEFYNGGKQNAI
jgi:3'-phosphoadenosine 5'-phosphosulfate sulfotransferase (PAPS reductase)/FAD synthetase